MSVKVRDTNRCELVKAIIKQNGGRIFTVIAKRKNPKVSYVNRQGTVSLKPAEYRKLIKLDPDAATQFVESIENFMTMTCRTGVKKDLKGGDSTIRKYDDLVSVHLTNGKGYRCFSAFNVLELRASGTNIKFKEEHVLEFEGE